MVPLDDATTLHRQPATLVERGCSGGCSGSSGGCGGDLALVGDAVGGGSGNAPDDDGGGGSGPDGGHPGGAVALRARQEVLEDPPVGEGTFHVLHKALDEHRL
eukprot:3903610-Heterocapsa_arctica.AAC.1